VLRRVAGIDVLQHARAAGKPRQLGYSGDGEAARYTAACGAFDTLQTFLNLADQEANRTDTRHGGTAIASRHTGSRDTSPCTERAQGGALSQQSCSRGPPRRPLSLSVPIGQIPKYRGPGAQRHPP
jgi:hypothetical protein